MQKIYFKFVNSEIVKAINNLKPADKQSLLSEMQAKVPEFQKRTQNTLKILTVVHEYLAVYA